MKLGIFSWNMGKNINDEKFAEIKQQILAQHQNDNSPDILVFGFQEIPVSIGRNISIKSIQVLLTLFFPEYTILKDNSGIDIDLNKSTACHGIFSAIGGGFGISTLIFWKKATFNETPPKVIKYLALCDSEFKKTKGYVALKVKISFNNTWNTIDIVNTHMPFKTTDASIKFYNKLEKWLTDNDFNSDNRIIFGDVNTRSLLTADCYKKNITSCSNSSNNSNNSNKPDYYCNLKQYLESMEINKTVGGNKSLNRNASDSCMLKKNLCSVDENILTTINNDSEVIKLLLDRDFIGNPPNCHNGPFHGYQEHPINFYPTYKRDTNTGLFKLIKKNDGRLPGYADRVFYKGNLTPEIYTSLKVLGNDHLPIYKSFDIKTSSNYSLDIYWIRHGLSCANIDKLHALKSPDPKLTEDGLKCSKKVGVEIQDITEIKEIDLVLCSSLKRAMETALAMFPGKEVYSVPYIKESGVGVDNTPSKLEHLKNYFKGRFNLILKYWTDNQPIRSDTTNIKLFFTEIIPGLIKEHLSDKMKTGIKIAVVTHSNLMKEHGIYKSKGGCKYTDKPNNNSVFKISYKYPNLSNMSELYTIHHHPKESLIDTPPTDTFLGCEKIHGGCCFDKVIGPTISCANDTKTCYSHKAISKSKDPRCSGEAEDINNSGYESNAGGGTKKRIPKRKSLKKKQPKLKKTRKLRTRK